MNEVNTPDPQTMDARVQKILDFVNAVLRGNPVPSDVVTACGDLIDSGLYGQLGTELNLLIFRVAREGLAARKAAITAVMNARFLDLGDTKH